MKIDGISFAMQEDGDPYANVPDAWMTELKEQFQAKENRARKELAEVVAGELGHRREQRRRSRKRVDRGRVPSR